MKAALVAVLVGGVLLVAGYVGIPVLIEKQTGVLNTDVQDLKMRIQKIEEESKAAVLQPDADAQKIIKTVNVVATKVKSIEDSLSKNMTNIDSALKQQKVAGEEATKKQAETLDKLTKELKVTIQRNMFNAVMANIRVHILKARGDLHYKNIGTAKTEFDLILDAFEKAKASASDDQKKLIEEFQAAIKRARSEADSDLPSAMNKVDMLWHETGKLLKKG